MHRICGTFNTPHTYYYGVQHPSHLHTLCRPEKCRAAACAGVRVKRAAAAGVRIMCQLQRYGSCSKSYLVDLLWCATLCTSGLLKLDVHLAAATGQQQQQHRHNEPAPKGEGQGRLCTQRDWNSKHVKRMRENLRRTVASLPCLAAPAPPLQALAWVSHLG